MRNSNLKKAKLEAAVALYRFKLQRHARWQEETGFDFTVWNDWALRSSADKYGVSVVRLKAALADTPEVVAQPRQM